MGDSDMHEFVTSGADHAAQFRNPFSRAKEALISKKNDILYGKPPVTASEPNMPPSLQYALEYKNGQLGPQEISTLINNNLTDLATYSLFKAFNNTPDTQQQFLESFVDTLITHPKDNEALTKVLRVAMSNVPEDTAIKGAKVAQVIRQGANLWKEKFEEVGEEIKEDVKGVTPVYIAYAGTLGLRQGVESLKDSGKKIMVLIPDWVDEKDNDYCGYEIDMQKEQGERVTTITKDFERPEEFIFIDDTRRNGVHAQVMWNFWTHNSGEPLSESHVRVVNFAPKTARI